MRKLVRICVLTASLAGVLGTSVPPAAAEEVAVAVYVGTATVHDSPNGIAFPCFPGVIDTGGNVSDCPVLGTDISTANLPTAHHPLTYTRLTFHDGDSAEVEFSTQPSGACVGADAVVGNPIHTLGTGPCVKVAAGTVHGYCGLTEGFITGLWNTRSTSAVSNVDGNRTYNFVARFTAVATVAVVRGSVVNQATGENGPLTGVFAAVPTDPVSCFDNDRKDFLLAGTSVAVLR